MASIDEACQSKEAWRQYFYEYNHEMTAVGRKGCAYNGSDWIASKRVIVYPTPGTQEHVGPVMHGMAELVDSLGLDFSIVSCESGSIDDMVRLSSKKLKLRFNRLAEFLVSWRFDRDDPSPHGVVVIVPHNLRGKCNSDNTGPKLASDNTCGVGSFGAGYVVMSVPPGKTYDVAQIAKHEAGHLLGLNPHHDRYKVNGYADSNCVMHASSSCSAMCGKCRDALWHFWKGIEDRTGKKYFK